MDEANGLLPNDTLTLFCEVSYTCSSLVFSTIVLFVVTKELKISHVLRALAWGRRLTMIEEE